MKHPSVDWYPIIILLRYETAMKLTAQMTHQQFNDMKNKVIDTAYKFFGLEIEPWAHDYACAPSAVRVYMGKSTYRWRIYFPETVALRYAHSDFDTRKKLRAAIDDVVSAEPV